MPEIAEVALYAHDLNDMVRGHRLFGVSFPNQKDWGATIVPRRMQRRILALAGDQLGFSSSGKALLMRSRSCEAPVVEFRLGMTGCFHTRLIPNWKRHCFLELRFEHCSIYFSDPRRFGRVMEPRPCGFALAGYEESSGFWCERHPKPCKGYLNRARISWLLGTGDRTGVGNYMANEALGRLRLSPFLPCHSEAEAVAILRKCGEIALQSYRHGGNSFGSGYYRLNGVEGRFAKHCRFYQNPQISRVVFQKRPVFSRFSNSLDRS